MQELLLFAIPLGVALVAGVFGWFSMHRRATPLYMLGLMLVLGGAALLYLAADTATGWDGIGHALLIAFGALPATAGLIVGGIIGLITRPQLMLPS
ncbi:MAG: hypothetical protein AAFN94_12940 [Pseudomonadota bacterium]